MLVRRRICKNTIFSEGTVERIFRYQKVTVSYKVLNDGYQKNNTEHFVRRRQTKTTSSYHTDEQLVCCRVVYFEVEEEVGKKKLFFKQI